VVTATADGGAVIDVGTMVITIGENGSVSNVASEHDTLAITFVKAGVTIANTRNRVSGGIAKNGAVNISNEPME
jgi:hypothetical protein